MKLITLYLPEPYIEKLKELQDLGLIPNRAEGLRQATIEFINKHVEYGHIKRLLHKETPAEKNPYDVSLEKLFK